MTCIKLDCLPQTAITTLYLEDEQERAAFDAQDVMEDLNLFGFQGPVSWVIKKSLQALLRRQQMERLTLSTNFRRRELHRPASSP
jgi:hypothetical protein